MACMWARPEPLTELYCVVSVFGLGLFVLTISFWAASWTSTKASEPLLKPLARESWVDSTRFILMVFIVMGHYVAIPCSYIAEQSYWLSPLLVWINLFVMPGFAALSGYLSKAPLTQERVGRLLTFVFFPYVLSKFVYFLWFSASLRALGVFDPFDAFEGFGLEWYLAVLLQWRLAVVLMSPLSKWALINCSLFIGLVSGNWVPGNAALALQRACSFFPFFVLGYTLDLGQLREVITRSGTCKWLLRLMYVGCLLFFFCCPDVAKVFLSNTLGDLNFDYAGALPLTAAANIAEEAKVLPNGLVPVVAPIAREHCGSEWALSFVHRLVRYELGAVLLLGLLAWSPASAAMAQHGQHTMYPYLLHPWVFQLIVSPIMARHMSALAHSFHGYSSGGSVWIYSVLFAPILTIALSSAPVRCLTCVVIEPTWIGHLLFSHDTARQSRPCKSEGLSDLPVPACAATVTSNKAGPLVPTDFSNVRTFRQLA